MAAPPLADPHSHFCLNWFLAGPPIPTRLILSISIPVLEVTKCSHPPACFPSTSFSWSCFFLSLPPPRTALISFARVLSTPLKMRGFLFKSKMSLLWFLAKKVSWLVTSFATWVPGQEKSGLNYYSSLFRYLLEEFDK